MVQDGPGDVHPGGVEDEGVNHLLVLSGPYGDVIPGLKMLPPCVAPPRGPVWFPTICSTVTGVGVQLTFGFQEVNPVEGLAIALAGNSPRSAGAKIATRSPQQ